jgi:hypothetical protein
MGLGEGGGDRGGGDAERRGRRAGRLGHRRQGGNTVVRVGPARDGSNARPGSAGGLRARWRPRARLRRERRARAAGRDAGGRRRACPSIAGFELHARRGAEPRCSPS